MLRALSGWVGSVVALGIGKWRARKLGKLCGEGRRRKQLMGGLTDRLPPCPALPSHAHFNPPSAIVPMSPALHYLPKLYFPALCSIPHCELPCQIPSGLGNAVVCRLAQSCPPKPVPCPEYFAPDGLTRAQSIISSLVHPPIPETLTPTVSVK